MASPIGLLAQAGDRIGGAVQDLATKGKSAFQRATRSAGGTDPRPASRRTTDIALPPVRRKSTMGRSATGRR